MLNRLFGKTIARSDLDNKPYAGSKREMEAVADVDEKLITLDGVRHFDLKLHPVGDDAFISTMIRANGIWEPFETEIFKRLLPIYSVFLDLGANIGWYTAIALNIMRADSNIYAFEPDPANLRLLRQNTVSDGGVTSQVVAAAVSDSVGTATLYHSAHNRGDHRLYVSEQRSSWAVVPTTSLDAYFGGHPVPPCFVKMDTQGSEPKILRGAQSVLPPSERRSAFVVEFWPHGIANAGEDLGEFISLASTYSQQPFLIDDDACRLRPVSWAQLEERSRGDLAPSTENFVNILMVTPGSAAHMAVFDLVEV